MSRKHFYISGSRGSYIELDNGWWADTVAGLSDLPGNTDVDAYLDFLKGIADMHNQEARDWPLLTGMSLDELKCYVGAEDSREESKNV